MGRLADAVVAAARARAPRRVALVAPQVALVVLVALASVIGLAGCGAGTKPLPVQTHPSTRAVSPGGPPAHIAVVIMENEEYADLLGAGGTPYIHELARRHALAAQMYAITHPSLPNYLALTSGSTHGITSDCTDCTVPGSGLAGQLEHRGIGWKAYMEDLPRPCFIGAAAGGYAKKHDPFVYYDGIRGDRSACARIVPLGRLAADEQGGALPQFVWISPNLCHDMHDCDPATGDRFLAATLPRLLGALGPRGLLILTWDEGSTDNGCCKLASGGHVVTILAGGLARAGATLRTPTDHYSVLQTIEDLLGLSRIGGAACACTPSLAPLLAPAGRPSRLRTATAPG
jgi:acid phosphatase